MPVIEVPNAEFGDQTEEIIRDRIFAAMESDLDQGQGSMAWNLVTPVAIELSQLYDSLDLAVDIGFIQSTFGLYLDARAEEYGIFRQSAEKAIVSVVFTGANGTVPKDTQIGNTILAGSNEEIVVFSTDEDAVISGGSAPAVTATAVTEGADGNVPIAGVDRMVDTVAIVTSLTNAAAATGGRDLETDDKFRDRFLVFTSQWRGAGSANDYKAWAMEASTVVWKVDVIERTVPALDVYLYDVEFVPVGATETAKVADFIATTRPIGADATINDGAVVSVAVDVAATYYAGSSDNTERGEAEILVQAYIDSLETEEIVRQSKIEGAVAQLAGVQNVTGSTINSVDADYTPAADTLMRMSTFSL